MNYKNTRKKQNDNNIEDIQDGSRYRKLRNEGWFVDGGETTDVGVAIGLDGVALFNRNSVQAWPVWGVICNLPPHER